MLIYVPKISFKLILRGGDYPLAPLINVERIHYLIIKDIEIQTESFPTGESYYDLQMDCFVTGGVKEFLFENLYYVDYFRNLCFEIWGDSHTLKNVSTRKI